jgi:hypothetical protein
MIMRSSILARRAMVVATTLALLATAACGGDDNCLVYNENCSAAYRQAHGNANCCSGTCQEGFNGNLICR